MVFPVAKSRLVQKYVRPFTVATAFIALGGGITACQSLFSARTVNPNPVMLTGAGATFPAPLYQRWIAEFRGTPAFENVTIAYDSVGSGKGIKRYLAQDVDFGATDAPLKPDERKAFPPERGDIIQVPMTGGLVVFSYNLGDLPGAENLKLSRAVYCGIVTGEITNWNDLKLAADNPGIVLPDLPILFVHRSDSSGTTFIFTSHIEAACPNWKVGSGKNVEWPTGLGADGNKGVSAEIKQSNGAIGYIEYSYAKANQLAMATLENKSGQFVIPSAENGSAVFDGVQIPDDFSLNIPDPEASNAYPIVGLTWLLIYGKYDDPAKAKTLTEFVRWSLTKGKDYAVEIGYLPLSKDLKDRVISSLESRQK